MRGEAFILVGSTATGKTDVAQLLAEENDDSILSADSMLVYKGMDIGTAKPTAEQRRRVAYHGLDLVSPSERFSVGDYLACCRNINVRPGSRLLVTGGTGLYIKALMNGLSHAPPVCESRRESRLAIVEKRGVGGLQAELQERAPALYESLEDPSNPRRLIRALERVDAGADSLPDGWQQEGGQGVVGIRLPREDLNARIEKRVARMYDQGLVDEGVRLKASASAISKTALQAIGYREVFELLEGTCTKQEAMERTVIRTRQLAKRQRTWFRHQLDVDWIDIEASMSVADVAERVKARWQRKGPLRLKGLENDGLQD